MKKEMNELLEAAKDLLEEFDSYGPPVQLRVIAKLRRATEAAQQCADDEGDLVVRDSAGVVTCKVCGTGLWIE